MLILGEWACLVICSVVYCLFFYLFFFSFFFSFVDFLFFFSFMDFLFFCKFNCSWHFFTSSGHVAQRLRFENGYWRVVSYTIDDLGKREAWLTRFDEYGTLKRRLTTGLGGRCLGAGRCPVVPPAAWSWLDDLGDDVNCFIFLSFENPWRLLAECWNGEKFLAQLLQGWNYQARGHICCYPPMRVSPDATHKKLLRLMMLTIAGSLMGMEYCWG